MMINEDTYGSLTPGKAKEIVRNIKSAEERK
jgi:NADH:ubiquinone oxidoreductase subunit E